MSHGTQCQYVLLVMLIMVLQVMFARFLHCITGEDTFFECLQISCFFLNFCLFQHSLVGNNSRKVYCFPVMTFFPFLLYLLIFFHKSCFALLCSFICNMLYLGYLFYLCAVTVIQIVALTIVNQYRLVLCFFFNLMPPSFVVPRDVLGSPHTFFVPALESTSSLRN